MKGGSMCRRIDYCHWSFVVLAAVLGVCFGWIIVSLISNPESYFVEEIVWQSEQVTQAEVVSIPKGKRRNESYMFEAYIKGKNEIVSVRVDPPWTQRIGLGGKINFSSITFSSIGGPITIHEFIPPSTE
jgi:hypothetical protein